MERRGFLGLLPAVFLAGCAGQLSRGSGGNSTPDVGPSDGAVGRSKAIRAMDASDGSPEVTVHLHDDPKVPGKSPSTYVPLDQLMLTAAITRSWGETIDYEGQSNVSARIDPPEWPARGIVACLNHDFENPFRERIGFEVTKDGALSITTYQTPYTER